MSRPARTVPRAEAGAAGTAQDRPMTDRGRPWSAYDHGLVTPARATGDW